MATNKKFAFDGGTTECPGYYAGYAENGTWQISGYYPTFAEAKTCAQSIASAKSGRKVNIFAIVGTVASETTLKTKTLDEMIKERIELEKAGVYDK